MGRKLTGKYRRSADEEAALAKARKPKSEAHGGIGGSRNKERLKEKPHTQALRLKRPNGTLVVTIEHLRRDGLFTGKARVVGERFEFKKTR